MYGADFDAADRLFRTAACVNSPAPSFFVGLNLLWKALVQSDEGRITPLLISRAEETIARADKGIETPGRDVGTYFFWRGMGRSLRLAALFAPQILEGEKRDFSLDGLLRGFSALTTLSAARADFSEAAKRHPDLPDARSMGILLQQCNAPVIDSCITELWAHANENRWIETEIKYILLNLVFNRHHLDDMGVRAIPLALELHLRYPSNGLFHLALTKVSLETGNLDECRSYASEIVSAPYANLFGNEAHYLLGMADFGSHDYSEALKEFQAVIIAAPSRPAYVLPWSYFRAAQCAVHLNEQKNAKSYLESALRNSGASSNLRYAARRMLSEIVAASR
ncbi:MAG TPA: hypothetical protein VMF91_25830 [Bryobacteraceae bacterium]|nr:hypothetical protein [Bryobacteraceae bacterium]